MPTTVKLPKKQEQATADSKPALISPEASPDKLIKNITFFGDSAIPEEDPIYQSVWQCARLLATKGYGIVNGGGPGIMKAATDGAESVDGKTIAIYWEPKLATYFEGKNLSNVTDESEAYSNYMMRTLGLVQKGDAYVVCKGGTGTISEWGMVWAISKLYYGCHKPVILYGDFWDELIEAFQKAMILDEIELGVLYKAQTPEEVLALIEEHEEKVKHSYYDMKRAVGQNDESGFLISPQAAVTVEAYDQHGSNYHSQHAGKLVAQEQLDEFISLVNAPARVLDIGTGPGYDLSYLATKYSAMGIEPSRKFVEIARYENPELEIVHAGISDYEIPQSTFKGIWARDSLHHLPATELDAVFGKLAGALVPGGILYAIVREGEGEVIERESKVYGDLERFYHFFTAEELTQRAEKAGLTLVKLDRTKRSHDWLVGVFKKPEA
jgi:predicted Rossmann-fold nucleotide-binding protein/SAM-dependent methyltransferase